MRNRAATRLVACVPLLLAVADFGMARRETGVDEQNQRQREQTGDCDPEGRGVGIDHHHVERWRNRNFAKL